MSGLLRAKAIALAALRPTSSAPASPGPQVTATASMPSQSRPAWRIASSSVGISVTMCWREASSGTTPPKRWCRPICEAIIFASTSRPSRTMATDVSSHDVSIARIFTGAWLLPAARRGRGSRAAPFRGGMLPGCRQMQAPGAFLGILADHARLELGPQAAQAVAKRGRLQRLAPHQVGVLAVVTVIMLARAGDGQPILLVQVLGHAIADAHFEGQPGRSLLQGDVDHGEEQQLAHMAAPVGGRHADGGDVRLLAHEPQAREP